MTNDTERTAVLGDEHDDQLRDALLEVLLELGAGGASHSRAVAGSQEIESLRVSIDGEVLIVDAETYMGLTVRGDRALVDRVESMLKARIGNRPP